MDGVSVSVPVFDRHRRHGRRRGGLGVQRNRTSGRNSVAVVVDVEDLGDRSLDEVDDEEAATQHLRVLMLT